MFGTHFADREQQYWEVDCDLRGKYSGPCLGGKWKMRGSWMAAEFEVSREKSKKRLAPSWLCWSVWLRCSGGQLTALEHHQLHAF